MPSPYETLVWHAMEYGRRFAHRKVASYITVAKHMAFESIRSGDPVLALVALVTLAFILNPAETTKLLMELRGTLKIGVGETPPCQLTT